MPYFRKSESTSLTLSFTTFSSLLSFPFCLWCTLASIRTTVFCSDFRSESEEKEYLLVWISFALLVTYSKYKDKCKCTYTDRQPTTHKTEKDKRLEERRALFAFYVVGWVKGKEIGGESLRNWINKRTELKKLRWLNFNCWRELYLRKMDKKMLEKEEEAEGKEKLMAEDKETFKWRSWCKNVAYVDLV